MNIIEQRAKALELATAGGDIRVEHVTMRAAAYLAFLMDTATPVASPEFVWPKVTAPTGGYRSWPRFSIGDNIECTDASGCANLRTTHTYRVSGTDGQGLVTLATLPGWYGTRRFKLVDRAADMSDHEHCGAVDLDGKTGIPCATAEPVRFEPRDIVECVEDGDYPRLKNGQFYGIADPAYMGKYIQLADGSGGWSASRFRLIARAADGWKIWKGGECPVPGAKVEVKFRGGDQHESSAENFRWENAANSVRKLSAGADIIAYRVVEEAKAEEPAITPAPVYERKAFKPGDRVRCISTDKSRGFEVGEVYTVKQHDLSRDGQASWDMLTVKETDSLGMFAWRFEHANDALQPGDRVHHGGEVCEVVAGPRRWLSREEVALWSDDSGYTHAAVDDCERVS
jgi:hypothetical protein